MVRCQLACYPEVAAKERKDNKEQSFISTKEAEYQRLKCYAGFYPRIVFFYGN